MSRARLDAHSIVAPHSDRNMMALIRSCIMCSIYVSSLPLVQGLLLWLGYISCGYAGSEIEKGNGAAALAWDLAGAPII